MDLLLVFIDLFRTKSVVHSLLLRPDFMIETCIYVPYKKEHLYDKIVFSFQSNTEERRFALVFYHHRKTSLSLKLTSLINVSSERL